MTASEFCRIVENRLGWVAPDGPAWKRYQVPASLVTKKIRTDPKLYTWKNLLLAVELLARERESRTPLGVFAHVERALKVAREETSDLEVLIQEAIKVEQHRGDPDGWVIRFARATGWWRAEAYKEWRNEQAKPQ